MNLFTNGFRVLVNILSNRAIGLRVRLVALSVAHRHLAATPMLGTEFLGVHDKQPQWVLRVDVSRVIPAHVVPSQVHGTGDPHEPRQLRTVPIGARVTRSGATFQRDWYASS